MDEAPRETVRARVRRGRRTAQMASVLARHGLGGLAVISGLRRGRDATELGDGEPIAEAGPFAAAAADLGPAFVRLAQLAATRVDVLTAPQRTELAATALQSGAPTVDELAAVLDEHLGEDARHALGVDADDVRASTPTAWTFGGHLDDGRTVEVTVRPVGLVSSVERDLAAMAPAVRLLARRGDVDARLDLVAAFERLAAQVRGELDLTHAAHVLDRCRLVEPSVVAAPVWARTTAGVLVVAEPSAGLTGDADRATALATVLLDVLAADGWAVLGLGVALDQAPLRLARPLQVAEVAPAAVALLGHLVGALLVGDDDVLLDQLAAGAVRRSGGARAALDAQVRGQLAEARAGARRLGPTLEAVLAAAGRAGLSFETDLLLAVAALVELDTALGPALGPALDAAVADGLADHPAGRGQAAATPPVRRPAERKGPVIGLVLSGGAVRGAGHVGALAALVEAGVRPDLVVGTSAGAIIGALLAAGTGPDELARIVGAMRWSTLARPLPRRLSLFDTAPMEAFLDRLLGDLRFEDLLCPFAAVACDLATGGRVVLDHGPLAPAVRASAALPGIFPPVELEDRLLVDGGVIDNLPVDVAYDLGAEFVIAVDVSAPMGGRPASAVDVLSIATGIMTKLQERGRRRPDVLIRADLAELASVGDIPTIVARGRAAAEELLPGLLAELAARRR